MGKTVYSSVPVLHAGKLLPLVVNSAYYAGSIRAGCIIDARVDLIL